MAPVIGKITDDILEHNKEALAHLTGLGGKITVRPDKVQVKTLEVEVMDYSQMPFILSPGLGCPRILGLDDNEVDFPVVLAAREKPSCRFSLVLSASNRDEDNLPTVKLDTVSIEEITFDPTRLPSTVDETWESISREFGANVFEGGARFYKVTLQLSDPDKGKLLRNVNGQPRATLYDLLMQGPVEQNKPHALCLTASKDGEVRFIHLTDLHLARRNELIKDEIATAVGSGAITMYNNFNDRVRDFISKANSMADAGELDFVLIGGDLVDFVNHGISDEIEYKDNNWDVLIEVLTGRGNEKEKENCGIKVPVFTTTGNHDWRLHPFNVRTNPGPYGISRSEAEQFDFEYYDTVDAINAKKRDVYEKIVKEGSPVQKENWLHAAVKWFLTRSETWVAKTLAPSIAVILTWLVDHFSPGLDVETETTIIVPLVVFAVHNGTNAVLKRIIYLGVTDGIIPIEASVKALHYYFLHINPYFNYAFSYGKNYFILMDTGPDCLSGQIFWDGGGKKARRISIKDNILGGSPDSMSFYPANEYYTYGQIPWLESVLGAIKEADGRRVFVCLHSPPVNVKKPPYLGNSEVLLKKSRVNAKYGTTNHYVSQFLHLCLGRKEGDNKYSGPKVDIVFSGHTHQKTEFRVDNNMGIYCGRYSKTASGANFDKLKPYIVQTCAAGPLSGDYQKPPYYRVVHVDGRGAVTGFVHLPER